MAVPRQQLRQGSFARSDDGQGDHECWDHDRCSSGFYDQGLPGSNNNRLLDFRRKPANNHGSHYFGAPLDNQRSFHHRQAHGSLYRPFVHHRCDLLQ